MSRLRLFGFLLVAAVAVAGWITTYVSWQVQRVAAGVVPLDPRDFETLTVVAVGTGGAYENPDRRGPAIALGLGTEIVLVDAGRAVAEGLRAARIPVAQPRRVLLTSLLPENTVGLDDLLLTGWREGRDQPLEIYGPVGTRALAEGLRAGHAAGVAAWQQALDLPAEGASFQAREWVGGETLQLDRLALRCASQPEGPTPTLAHRAEAEGRAVVVAGAGWGEAALIELARAADLLVHEATVTPAPELGETLGVGAERLRREAALHAQLDRVGSVAARAGVATLALVRLRPPPVYDFQYSGPVAESFGGRVWVPDDGDELAP